MALKGSGKALKSSPYGDSVKSLKSSPYGKLPSKSTTKPKKDAPSSKDARSSNNSTPGQKVALNEVFGILADENGRITSAKLRSYVKELDLDFTEEEVKDMMKVVDPAGKGEVSFNNLLGIVRDFSQEFPTVQLTTEELNRELTYESITTEDSTKESSIEDVSEQPGTSEQGIANSEETLTGENKSETNRVIRPISSRARIAAIAKRAIDDLDDQMSVIREDDEYEEENENEQEGNNKITTDEKPEKEDGHVEGVGIVGNDDNENGTDSIDDNQSVSSRREKAVSALSVEDSNLVDDVFTNGDATKEDDLSEIEPDSNSIEYRPSRASIVKEHRLDSGVSTAIGRMSLAPEEQKIKAENARQSRKRSTSEGRTKSRRDSVKSDQSRKSDQKGREQSNSKSRNPDENKKSMQPARRKSVPRKKFHGVNDPEFYSTMGCSLKLSQIRTRQRLLYVMWRAVYDQALKKMEQEKAKHQTQKRKNSKRATQSVNAV